MKAQSGLASCALLAGVACGGSASGPATPSCPGVCTPSKLSTLGVLAGQPGGPGWVDGTLVAAHFSDPWTIRGDGQGHLYVADRNMIRAVDLTAGKVTTLAGSFATVGLADGPGAQATFNLPSGLAYVGGALYVTDTENHTVRKIDLASTTVTTLFGTPRQPGSADGTGPAAAFREPEGLAADDAGHLFVSDTDNGTIRELYLASLAVTTLAGTAGVTGSSDGVGSAATFYKPKDVCFDGAGDLYVVDALNERLRKVVLATGQVSTLATFDTLPQGVGVDGSNALVSLADHRIVSVAPDGTTTTLAGSAGAAGFVDGPGASARFDSPAGLWNGGAGTVYVADNLNTALRTLSLPGHEVGTFAGARSLGSANGPGAQARFSAPLGLATDGASVYVADTGNDVVRKIDVGTRVVTTVAGAVGQTGLTDGAGGAARFNAPAGVALDAANGRLYVADTGNRILRRIDLETGTVTTLALATAADASFGGFDAPTGIALAGGKLFVTDYTDDIVAVVDLQAATVATFAGQFAMPGYADGTGGAATFYGPEGLCTDGRGSLYVTDNLADTVRKIDVASGRVSTLAGRAMSPGSSDGTASGALFDSPVGVAANALGDVFVSDSLDDTVRRIDAATGAVTTVLGTLAVPGVRLGPAPGQLTQPTALALTPSGELLIVSENSVLVAR